ncbi:MAG: SusD/RagB family nutrient-binding outer membrane lipoprotein [Bacteroidetes bacterium]|nr:SusD/RagB family nutrient-binding outer membrane lipoprotein [Bacteroidota bacterium]
MKKNIVFVVLMLLLSITACKKDKFAEYYVDPSSIGATSIEKQFSGSVSSMLDYTMYRYWNYFVVLQNTALHYTQAVAWQNGPKQYEPGSAAIGARWGAYYGFVAQYKELLKVYNSAPTSEQKDKRIYLIAGTIFYYDQTQKMVDLHGDIPWSAAGLLSTNNGDYGKSYAKYDDAATIYTKMLDDLKAYADELNTLSVPSGMAGIFKTQDFINKGDLTMWKKYCNSLRVRMLMRVSGVSSFQSRVSTEMAAIVGAPSTYPVCSTSSDNILIKVNSLDNSSVTSDLYSGIIGWGSNDRANKMMIDTMQNNADPRLRAMFQPGVLSGTKYIGLDPLMDATSQGKLFAKDTLARYNLSTISKNKKLPGILVTSAATQLLLADYYLNIANNDAAAKTAYETGIKNSIDYYYMLRSISDNNETAVAPTSDAEKTAYLSSNISWGKASSKATKQNLIALQKWINYSVLEPLESWAEIRRTNLPVLKFLNDNTSSLVQQPPMRWTYPDDERVYNATNYNTVKAKDNLTTKIFWDIN